MCSAVLIIVTFRVGTSSKPRLKLRFLILVRTLSYTCTKKNSSAGMTIFTTITRWSFIYEAFFVGQRKPEVHGYMSSLFTKQEYAAQFLS